MKGVAVNGVAVRLARANYKVGIKTRRHRVGLLTMPSQPPWEKTHHDNDKRSSRSRNLK